MAKYPYRAPMAVVEALRPYVKGKTYCELGTHDGDIMLEVSKYAKSVIGIEWGPIQYDSCISKGLNVILGTSIKLMYQKQRYILYGVVTLLNQPNLYILLIQVRGFLEDDQKMHYLNQIKEL